MAAPIVGTPTLKEKVDLFLGDDGEVGIRRWFWRGVRRLGASDEWLDKTLFISAWFRHRFDDNPKNDSRWDHPTWPPGGVSLSRRF